MADLIADFNYIDTTLDGLPVRLTDAITVFKGSIIGYDTATGLAVKFADVATISLLGIATGGATGDTSADDPPEVSIDTRGIVLKRVNVTGVSAITSQFATVDLATDNPADFKLASNTNNKQVGYITRFYSGAICDVKLYDPDTQKNLA